MNLPTAIAGLCVILIVFFPVRSLLRNRGHSCSCCDQCGKCAHRK